jgi:hypothetical protein
MGHAAQLTATGHRLGKGHTLTIPHTPGFAGKSQLNANLIAAKKAAANNKLKVPHHQKTPSLLQNPPSIMPPDRGTAREV